MWAPEQMGVSHPTAGKSSQLSHVINPHTLTNALSNVLQKHRKINYSSPLISNVLHRIISSLHSPHQLCKLLGIVIKLQDLKPDQLCSNNVNINRRTPSSHSPVFSPQSFTNTVKCLFKLQILGEKQKHSSTWKDWRGQYRRHTITRR